MSVSDPMLKELKGHAQHLVEVQTVISDSYDHVTGFCECVEKIFQQGLVASVTFFKPPESWDWLELMADNKFGTPYNYQSSVIAVKKCSKLRTNRGRIRLLIRTCLVKRCLHIPVQTLLNSGECKGIYIKRSILGDEILSQILFSVLMSVSRLQFNLELENARFLDDTWVLPNTKRLELVPCKELGVTVLFVQGKALAHEILPNSVAAEDDHIEIGDILDELNGYCITNQVQGMLTNIMKKNAGLPVSVYIIKARWNDSIFPPLVPLLMEAGLDPVVLQAKFAQNDQYKAAIKNDMSQLTITYIGNTSTGSNGDVKQIRGAIDDMINGGGNQVDKLVSFECLDLGVKVCDASSKNVILKHSYMDISSCGCAVNIPYYFAYIAGNESFSLCENFTCYVFHCNIQKEIDSILQSIGQGFKRTQYVV
ncbi:uncharacterized protein LOC142326280 isoform X2 [Lycorma delicatula]|uniref:uncharacterized protein LOC142326280 isoform X2 n=1 Tax=Lycorma delicatula TaxID=130591 RepID=UPI003F514C2A